MQWYVFLAYFFGGAFLANAVPHVVNGMSGRPFQTPFASPPGQGLSSSTVNVLWGWANLVIGYLLLGQVGSFDPRNLLDMALPVLGGLILALILARRFGRFHGGLLQDAGNSAG
ncbi:MAG: hypothetical protein JWN11_846 [Hyphomicrobiales bacterium]|nr:hypothetical protein [Hyphomicrobiales bacterium]